jgi:hypothetical protein
LSAINRFVERFLFKNTQPESSLNQGSNEEERNESAASPSLKTLASASQHHFAGFFEKEYLLTEVLSLEVFKLNLQKEIEELKAFLSQNHYQNIHEIKSSATFWMKCYRISSLKLIGKNVA